MKYRCSKCMYEFDEDSEEMSFENLPEHWRCPECGGQIYYFEKDEARSSINYFEEKRKKILKEIDELDNDFENETHQTINTTKEQIITKKEIVGIIILIVVCSLVGWGIVSFCNYLIHSM